MKAVHVMNVFRSVVACYLAMSTISAAHAETIPCGKVDLKSCLRALTQSGTVAGLGAMVISPDGIEQEAFTGWADLESRRPLTRTNMFWMASMTKYITSIAVEIAQDEGKLKIDDPVSNYIPSLAKCRVTEAADANGVSRLVPLVRPMTIRHCLGYTAGFGTLALPNCDRSSPDLHTFYTLASQVELAAAIPLVSQPGEKWRYSNTGFNVAARCVEIATGIEFSDYLRMKIFEPLGMVDTTFNPSAEQRSRLVQAYAHNRDKRELRKSEWFNIPKRFADGRHIPPEAGGGIYSTPADMAKFTQMIIAGGIYGGKRIVSEAGIEDTAKSGLGCEPRDGGIRWRKDGAYQTEYFFSKPHKRALLWMPQVWNGSVGNVDWLDEANQHVKVAVIDELFYANQRKRTLVWNDEFDGTGLPDASKWDYETGYVRNKEAQEYRVASLKNSHLENGKLVIEAHKEAEGKVSSASVMTRGKKDFLYGRIDVSAKMPRGVGVWPAIWTLGTNIGEKNVGWPSCGEIDIMEFVGFQPGMTHFNVHTYGTICLDKGKNTLVAKGWQIPCADLSDKFHVYSLDWTEKNLKMFFDNMLVGVYPKLKGQPDYWPFDKPQYLLLNLAIGGAWGGQKGIDDSIFPARYEIDFVRYYK